MEKQRIGGIIVLLSGAPAISFGVIFLSQVFQIGFLLNFLVSLIFLIPGGLIILGGIRIIYHKSHGVLALCSISVVFGEILFFFILSLGSYNWWMNLVFYVTSLTILGLGLVAALFCFRNRKRKTSMVKPRLGGILMLIGGGYIFYLGFIGLCVTIYRAFFDPYIMTLPDDLIFTLSGGAVLSGAMFLLNEDVQGRLWGLIGGIVALGGSIVLLILDIIRILSSTHPEFVVDALFFGIISLQFIILGIIGSRVGLKSPPPDLWGISTHPEERTERNGTIPMEFSVEYLVVFNDSVNPSRYNQLEQEISEQIGTLLRRYQSIIRINYTRDSSQLTIRIELLNEGVRKEIEEILYVYLFKKTDEVSFQFIE